ncbi:MAG TPA: hypothetical protein VIZ65_18140 [Cellvibrionaceae bacterium]
MPRKITITLLILFSLFSSAVWSHEYNAVCGVSDKDVLDAKGVLKSSNKYLATLNGIDFKSFKNIKASSENVASLVEEKTKLIKSFESIVSSAESLQSKSTKCSAQEWNNILYNVAFSIRYMEDLERYELIKSCESCWFSVMVTTNASENISIKLRNIEIKK